MAFRPGKWLIVIALIFSVGGHWAFLQTVAWTGMAINYSQETSIRQALVKTFNGQNPCRLCKFVSDGKNSDQKAEKEFALKKFDSFAYAQSDFWFPAFQQSSMGPVEIPHGILKSPPVPPPLLS